MRSLTTVMVRRIALAAAQRPPSLARIVPLQRTRPRKDAVVGRD
jgi:hypothetical protein